MCHNNLCLYCYLLDIGDASSGSTSETRRDQSDKPGKNVCDWTTSSFLLIIIVVSQSVNASTSSLSSTTGDHCAGILDQGISRCYSCYFGYC